jgi:hypothetical protein
MNVKVAFVSKLGFVGWDEMVGAGGLATVQE